MTIQGNKVVDSGLCIETTNQSFTTTKNGLYHITFDAVASVATDGFCTFAIYMDGTILPCTLKESILLPTGDTSVHTETDIIIDDVCCMQTTHAFTLVVTPTVAGSIVNMRSGMMKIS